MLAGFLVLGGCTVAFGAALRGSATGGAGPGPALIVCAGLLAVAAGLLRRDHTWRHCRLWLLASAAATGVILIAYATDVTGPAAAILQRARGHPASSRRRQRGPAHMARTGPSGQRRPADRHALTAPR